MIQIREKIKESIEQAIKNSIEAFAMGEIFVEHPANKPYGDYFTNVSFNLAKVLNKKPNEIASLLKTELEKNVLLFDKVEVVNGFLNFFIHKNFFKENLENILREKNNFGKNKNLKNKKIFIEYTDPNPFKNFHIGHFMSNAIGESISRIFEFHSAKVFRACYQGDVGLHVAKAIFGKIRNPGQSWQDSYVLGSSLYDQSEEAKKEIIDINKKIFERSDKEINKLYDQGKKESLEYFDKIYRLLDTKFDEYFFESEMADFGRKIVERGMIHGIFEKGEQGAIIFKGEKYGLHTRVFINSEGLPTYEAKELALAHIKEKRRKHDLSIIVTGNEIDDYFKVLLIVLRQISPELAEKTVHISHGMLRLPEGKISSRTGKIVVFENLLDKVEKIIKSKITNKYLQEEEKNDIAKKAALGSLKYSVLRQSIGKDIIYNFEKSISLHGDSGPYLQYSLARSLSILKKAEKEKIKPSLKIIPQQISLLAKSLLFFPEVVEKAGEEKEPHYIVSYLTDLASLFNSYYAENIIVDKSDEFSPYKIALTKAFSYVMKNGMWLLGISCPEKM